MARLDAYIPIDRRYALSHDQSLPDRAVGAVLFADISGFSTTAVALARALGPRQGADELMTHVNRLYTDLISEVHRYGGSVITFSGDSLTCWFDRYLPPDPEHKVTSDNSSERATACALAMQEVVSEAHRSASAGLANIPAPQRREATEPVLSIKVSVVAGHVRRLLAGSPEIQLVEVLAGALLDRSAAAERVLEPGQIVVGAEILGHFGSRLEVSEWVEGANGEHFALVSGLTEGVRDRPWPRLPEIEPQTVRSWLLPSIYRRLRRGEEDFLAELRPSVALFLQFAGIDYDGDDAAGEKLDAFVRWVQEVLGQYDGQLLQVTVGDKGSYAMASTSATMAHEDDVLRAIAATQALLALPPEINFITDLKAGISWGTMLVGAYGSEDRRTFSEQGTEANLAARLMEEAQAGEILISGPVADAVQQEYDLRALGTRQLKGWSEAVPIFAVIRRRRAPIVPLTAEQAQPIVGRQAERALFRSCMERLRERQSSAIVMEGEAGIGKSRLLEAFLEEAEQSGRPALLGEGDAIERATPFHAWRPIFRSILRLAPGEAQDVVHQRILNFLPEPYLEPVAPGGVEAESRRAAPLEQAALVGNALALCQVDESLETRLETELSAGRLREMLLGILREWSRESEQIVILDDAQWIDSASWALLNDLRQTLLPLLIVIASRPVRKDALLPKEFEGLLADAGTTHIDLAALAPEESTVMVAQHLGVRSLPEPVSAFIRQRAGGHPFFSEEIAHALIEAGILQIQDSESRLVTQNGGLDHLDFPGTVQGVIASRIDRLNAATQLTLKVASVIGPTFNFDMLYDIHPVAADKENLHEHLNDLTRLDITAVDSSSGEASYVFKHALIQEIAYGRLLIAQRRQLHRAVAEWLENTHASNVPSYYPLLAYHWGRAAKARAGRDQQLDLAEKALHYADKSGEQALRNSAYREAISFYDDALTFAAEPGLHVATEQRAHYLQRLGEAYHQWGQWSEGREKLVQAAALYGHPVPTSPTGVMLGILWQALIQLRNRIWPGRYVGKAPEAERETVLKIAQLFQTLSELSFLTNDSSFSLYSILQGLNLSEEGGPSPELVNAYADICVIAGLFGPQRIAEGYGNRAWRAAQTLDDPALKAAVKSALGLNKLNAGELEAAQANFEEALRISEALGDRRLWGDSLGLLARTIRFRGQLEPARELYAELSGPRSGVMMHRVWAFNAQALVALRQGELETALEFLRQAQHLPGERPEPQQALITWAYLGIARLQQKEWAAAREAADNAMGLMEQVGATAYTHFEPFAAVAMIYMSLWERELDRDSAQAQELQAMSRKICDALRRGTVKAGRPFSFLYLGLYNYLDGHPQRAYKHWHKGAAAAKEVGMPYELGRTYLEMGRRAAQDDPQREAYLQQAAELFDEIGATYYLDRVRTLMAERPGAADSSPGT